MKVSELGEFGLIDHLAGLAYASRDNRLPSWRDLLVGIGDDAAAWRGQTSTQLATVDALVQDVHFSLETTPWNDLGWKALAVNLSDIAAMGGLPKYALVALHLPGHIEVEDIITLYQGMLELARPSGVAIIGGNISSAPIVVITITVFGSIGNGDKHILKRSAAKAGEQVAVTGHLGGAAAGLEMLVKQLPFDPETATCLRKAFLHPSPRIAEGQLLLEHGVSTAIDISDGLVSDLKQLCKASQTGARIEVGRVPVHPVVRANFSDRALELALSGGEDYELLFTGSADVIAGIKKLASCPVTVIGEIVADRGGKVTLLDSKGGVFHPDKVGWEHFTKG